MAEDALGGRFELEAQVALGGMGSIYRGFDRQTLLPVAVKLLRYHEVKDVARFEREAEALAELSHPGIVRYVAHGKTPKGGPYLVMEWVDGETLWTRMHRRPLAAHESVVVALRVAEALGAAHAKGLVHRDVKPENVLLIGGRVDRVKVIDFGIVRRLEERRGALTASGATVGTPGYMAPEQARGLRTIDARADVFAIGCVLYECLTGRPTFFGENQMAVSLKILMEDPPRLRDLIVVPEPLDDLVSRMLAKDPDRRPSHGGALASELQVAGLGLLEGTDAWRPSIVPEAAAGVPATRASIEAYDETRSSDEVTGVRWVGPEAPDTAREEAPPSRPTVISVGVSALEQRVFSVVLADAGAPGRSESSFAALETPLRLAVEPFGGSLVILEGGAAVVTISGVGAATDQAARAARCALAMRDLSPEARIVVATGRGVASGAMPVGEVIDRGVRVLKSAPRGTIHVDDLTADLCGARFEILTKPSGWQLAGEVDLFEAARTLLGRPSPFVGREGELSTLELLFAECVGERKVRTVLVTGPAGSGKSRLRYEFLLRVREGETPVEVLFGQGDALSTGSPFAMLAPAVRRTAGILEGEPFQERRRKLRARLSRHLGGDALRLATTFLGEMIRAPVADGDPEDTPRLQAARADPRLMASEMQGAWETWIEVETAAAPLLLLLDDLQWGDRPSLDFIDAVIRRLPERPIMVVALARPEVVERFPGYFPGKKTTEIRLEALSPDASEALVRSALGESAEEPVVARIVERSDGNPFYLEEMTRSVAAGGASLPESVLGVLQARLDALPEPTRRVLRAASVFGSTFWWGGVSALLGGGEGAASLAQHVAELCAREVIYPRGTDVFVGETDYVFASDLLREAAYASLLEEDRTAGHLLAAEWLERVGEDDPVVLAEHFDRGGAKERAMVWYRRGADRALDANDFALALARAERAISCGATGEDRAALSLLMARAHEWRGENLDARRSAREAAGGAPRTTIWYGATAVEAVVCGRLGDRVGLREAGTKLLATWDRSAPSVDQISATATVATWLLLAGDSDLGVALLDRLERSGLALAEAHPRVGAQVQSAFARRARFEGDLVGFLRALERAVAGLEAGGDSRSACVERANLGFAYGELGLTARAEATLRAVVDEAEAMHTEFTAVLAKHVLGLVLLRKGAVEESRRLQTEAVEWIAASGANPRVEGRARVYLCMAHEAAGDVGAAEREAEKAVELLEGFPPGRAHALGRLSATRLAQGKTGAALDAARAAMGLLAESGGVPEGDAGIRLAFAQALRASGEADAAREVLADARARILARAERIADPEWRTSFLAVAENAKTLELAT